MELATIVYKQWNERAFKRNMVPTETWNHTKYKTKSNAYGITTKNGVIYTNVIIKAQKSIIFLLNV